MSDPAEAFEELVRRALDSIPDFLAEYADNVVVLVDDEPPPDLPGLLGLYEGVPLTERGSSYTFVRPDTIHLYRGPLVRRCATPEELVEQVRITVVHELAHHFGIDDEALDELGYG